MFLTTGLRPTGAYTPFNTAPPVQSGSKPDVILAPSLNPVGQLKIQQDCCRVITVFVNSSKVQHLECDLKDIEKRFTKVENDYQENLARLNSQLILTRNKIQALENVVKARNEYDKLTNVGFENDIEKQLKISIEQTAVIAQFTAAESEIEKFDISTDLSTEEYQLLITQEQQNLNKVNSQLSILLPCRVKQLDELGIEKQRLETSNKPLISLIKSNRTVLKLLESNAQNIVLEAQLIEDCTTVFTRIMQEQQMNKDKVVKSFKFWETNFSLTEATSPFAITSKELQESADSIKQLSDVINKLEVKLTRVNEKVKGEETKLLNQLESYRSQMASAVKDTTQASPQAEAEAILKMHKERQERMLKVSRLTTEILAKKAVLKEQETTYTENKKALDQKIVVAHKQLIASRKAALDKSVEAIDSSNATINICLDHIKSLAKK